MPPPKDHHHHSASLGEALPPLHPVAGSVAERDRGAPHPKTLGISLLSLRDADEEQEPEEAVRGEGRRRETESQDFVQA